MAPIIESPTNDTGQSPGFSAPTRRKLPKQVLNETKMINAAIDLLRDRPVDDVTSRLIAAYSETTVSYLTRYWGGRDEFLVDVAVEVGRRINVLVRAEQFQIHLDDLAGGLQKFMAMSDVKVWFKLYRYLASRDEVRTLEAAQPSAILVSLSDAVGVLFGFDTDESMSWALLALTLMMGNEAFGSLLGADDERFAGAVERLADAIKHRSAVVNSHRDPSEIDPIHERRQSTGRRGADRFTTP